MAKRVARGWRPRVRQQGFLDFSFPEVVITFGVALVVLGPKKLPGLVAQVGRWVGRARVMARQFREQLEQEVNAVNQEANSIKSSLNVVQPVPHPPAAPPATQPISPAGAAGTESPEVTAAAAPAQSGSAAASATSAPPEVAAAAQSFHADTPTHFRLNGTQPDVSFSNPLDESADAQPAMPPSAEAPPPGAQQPPAAGPADQAPPVEAAESMARRPQGAQP